MVLRNPLHNEIAVKEMKQVAALTPAASLSLLMALPLAILIAPPPGNTINEMEKYYTCENYKDDAFAAAALHRISLLKNIEDFKPVSKNIMRLFRRDK